MKAVPDGWDEAIAAPHRLATRATVLAGGTEEEIPITSGSVTLDATAASRGRLDLTVTDDGSLGYVPSDEDDLLNVYGNEIRVERGLYMPGDTEPTLLSLGIFGIQSVATEDTGAGLQIKIGGLDRSKQIIDARFEEPYQITVGTTYRQAIMDTILLGNPDAEFDFAEFGKAVQNVPLVATEQGDRWAFCQEMATACGMELYLDGEGTYTLRPKPTNVETPSVADIVDGVGGVLVNVSAEWNREGIYNRVIATGESTGLDAAVAPRGLATDDNPLSPTYYYGKFGRVPRFYASEMLYDDDDALNAATSILQGELGRSRKVSFGSVVNPALEPSDVISVRRERAGVDESHVLDSITLPLGPTEAMTGATRATQAVAL